DAFFEWRVKKVIAKIHNKNKRSIHVFHKIGFKFEKDLPVEKQYALTMNDYLKLA
ncbi:MAG TPA: N-acetyltransferase, partial [Clostridiales bacterium]|nr:N-acetyltransferase [Clostridiales bacterium]